MQSVSEAEVIPSIDEASGVSLGSAVDELVACELRSVLDLAEGYQYLGASAALRGLHEKHGLDAVDRVASSLGDEVARNLRIVNHRAEEVYTALKLAKISPTPEFAEHDGKTFSVRHDTNATDAMRNAEWKLGSHLFGVTTHYRERDDGLLQVHVEGDCDSLPLFEQLAVIREVELFSSWVPFCSSSTLIHELGKAEIVAHFTVSLGIPVFPLARDTALRCYGADCLYEYGCIVLMGRSIRHGSSRRSRSGAASSSSSSSPSETKDGHGHGDDDLESDADIAHLQIPWMKRSGGFFRFHDQMEILDMKAVFQVLTPTQAKVFSYGYAMLIMLLRHIHMSTWRMSAYESYIIIYHYHETAMDNSASIIIMTIKMMMIW